jgi:hypothetical protein
VFRGRASNPFTVQKTDPAAASYIFPANTSLDALLLRLDSDGWNLELCGNHGAGKTTLLHTLKSAALSRRWQVVHWRCCCHIRKLPFHWPFLLLLKPRAVFLDGAERLRPYQHHILTAVCRILNIGLITTTHQPVRHRFVYRVVAGEEQFLLLVCQCADNDHLELRAAAARFLREANFNAREALHHLYLWYEGRQ